MTKQERHLWYDFLKALPVTIKRQAVIDNKYIVDFLFPKGKIVIELDGSQHYENEGLQSDAERDIYLQTQGFKVLRFSNKDVNENFNGVCERILYQLKLYDD